MEHKNPLTTVSTPGGTRSRATIGNLIEVGLKSILSVKDEEAICIIPQVWNGFYM